MLFNAISFVWNEEDIIESSILNALCQGCDNVFIIDNGSTDSTIQKAVNAGAKFVTSIKTRYFDEREKICQLNSFVKYYNSLNIDDIIWWMYFDADEFISTHNELSLKELIMHLDKQIKAIKGYFYDHIPSYPPYNIERFHPIDFMPDCKISSTYKIPIIKYTNGDKHIFSAGGAHEIDTNYDEFLICENAIAIHHFQYRRPDSTLRRLKMLLPRLYWMDKRSEIIYKTRKSMYHSRY